MTLLPEACELPLQLIREEQVGQLALPVRAPLAVRPFALQVIEIDLAEDVRAAADRHDARGRRLQNQRQQQPGERKVPQVVGAELHLEPVGGRAVRDRHHARVVDQHVEPAVGSRKRFGEAADQTPGWRDRAPSPPVGARHRGTDGRGRLLAFGRVAHSQHDVRALPGQHFGRLKPKPTVGAGDQRGLAGLRGDILLDPAIEIGHLAPSFSFCRIYASGAHCTSEGGETWHPPLETPPRYLRKQE